jgi:hypothetical protein
MTTLAHALLPPRVVAQATLRMKAAFVHWMERMAERRMRKVEFEMRMYRGLYRHSSKIDDDLPIVR